MLGEKLDGRYEIHEELGRGGMGVVFRAQHLALGQSVAIKVLPTDKNCDDISIQRFIREAKRSFQIDHPNCVRVLDFGAAPSGLYMVMEYLDGRTISDEIHIDGPLNSPRVAHIARQVAEGLGHAHSHGLVHRDLKPLNIMLLQRGSDHDFAKIFDFGLSRLFDAGAIKTALSISPLTQEGQIFGTPEYMSPEQALGEALGPPADVYALGVCCYEMLTGVPPFQGKTFTEVLRQQVRNAPRPPTEIRPDLAIDPRLEALVLACLSKNPIQRPTVVDLARELQPKHTTSTPRHQISSAETVDFSQFALDAGSTTTDGSAPEMQSSPEPKSSVRKKRRSGLLIRGLAAAILAGGIFYLAVRKSAPDKQEFGLQSQLDASPTATKVSVSNDATVSAGTTISTDATISTGPLADAGKQLPKQTPTARRFRKHLQAAEAARRSKNDLTQLTEANAALRESPRNRRASFLVGDALLRSGDKVRACKYFRRSSKRDYRVAGCKD